MKKQFKFYDFTSEIPKPRITTRKWYRANQKKMRKEFNSKIRHFLAMKKRDHIVLNSRILYFLRGAVFKDFRLKASHRSSYIWGIGEGCTEKSVKRLGRYTSFISEKYRRIARSCMNTITLRDEFKWVFKKDFQENFRRFLVHFFYYIILKNNPLKRHSSPFSLRFFTRYKFFSFFGLVWLFVKIASEKEEEEILQLSSEDFCKYYYRTKVYSNRVFRRKKKFKRIALDKSRRDTCFWLRKISGSLMKKKKNPIDDIQFSRVFIYLNSFLRQIGTPDITSSTFFFTSFLKIRPYYQILYQNRPRSRIGVYKYYLDNNVRDIFPVRLFFKSLKYTKMPFRTRYDFEQRLARCVINVQDGRGVAVGSFRQFFRKEWRTRLVNKYGLTEKVF